MFTEITPKMKERMLFLESIDAEDRCNGTDRMKRLRQIPPKTGKFISILAASTPQGEMLEIGTSAGYSTMWLSLAAQLKNQKINTFELLPEKIQLAKETFRMVGITDLIELNEGDALTQLDRFQDISFCFIDCEKTMYMDCWNILCDKIVPGGMIIADNAINHIETLRPMIDKALSDDRFDSLVVPIGKGELVCRRKTVEIVDNGG